MKWQVYKSFFISSKGTQWEWSLPLSGISYLSTFRVIDTVSVFCSCLKFHLKFEILRFTWLHKINRTTQTAINIIICHTFKLCKLKVEWHSLWCTKYNPFLSFLQCCAHKELTEQLNWVNSYSLTVYFLHFLHTLYCNSECRANSLSLICLFSLSLSIGFLTV